MGGTGGGHPHSFGGWILKNSEREFFDEVWNLINKI